ALKPYSRDLRHYRRLSAGDAADDQARGADGADELVTRVRATVPVVSVPVAVAGLPVDSS
ncbi:hypothetical protein, partial [Frankia sp. Cr1]|uniref:hypothetical protein n=1 Tax=Frankia sp. Cr1 TaxID=3073931 RepID=UPI002AD4502A